MRGGNSGLISYVRESVTPYSLIQVEEGIWATHSIQQNDRMHLAYVSEVNFQP